MYRLTDYAPGPPQGREIIVDLFAGGGGASEGIRMALGRDPDVAVNHSPTAVAMHRANHPGTSHYTEDVWSVSPTYVTQGRPVGLLWASPDCTHHSKAKGGAPRRDDRLRSLALVLTDKWIPAVHPRVIIMENVEEITSWGPLDSRGQIIEAAKGDTWRMFIGRLRRQGYRVQWRELRACDYGAPTIRKRLFLIARRDGAPIVWPEPTHGDPQSEAVRSGRLRPWSTAAECIDWSLPCPSIFATSAEIWDQYGLRAKRPLAEATLRRIAEGVRRYVLTCAEPFVVKANHSANPGFQGQDMRHPLGTITQRPGHALVAPVITEHAHSTSPRNYTAAEPLRTQCAGVKGGHFALVAPLLEAHYGGSGSKAMRLPSIEEPLRTASTENRFGLVSAFLAKHFTGVVGAPLEAPAPTVTTRDHSAVVASSLVKMRGDNVGQALAEPLRTVSAQGLHHAEVRAFLQKYYGQGGQDQGAGDPLHTVTARARFGLVMVHGQAWQIVDIGMRMLAPRELFRAQGFREDYVIGDDPAQGLILTKEQQVRMCGNSVCPPMAQALAGANCAAMAQEQQAPACAG